MPGALKKYCKFAEIDFNKRSLTGFSIFVIFMLFPSFVLMAFDISEIQDTNKVVIQNADSVNKTKHDSIITHVPLHKHGSYSLTSDNSFYRISKHSLLWKNYFGMYDVIQKTLPDYPMSLGGYYNYNQISLFGGTSRDNNFRYNNRPINDLPFGTFNLNQYPTEFLENAEVFIGSDAVIFSGNSSGALINFQEPRYNANKIYTKLWINETGSTFIASDGIFSQNIFPNTNFTFGFRKVNSKGEYENQAVDGWNLRGILRFNLSDYTNISISEIFYNHYTEMNGGINSLISQEIFNPVDGIVNYFNFSDRQIRHDMNVTFSSILTKDTSSAISFTLFSTFANWTRELEPKISNIMNDSSAYLKFPANQYGVSGKYEQGIFKFASLSIGGDINYTFLEKNLFNDEFTGLHYAAFGHLIFKPDDQLAISGGIRLNSQLNKFYNSFGGKILYTPIKASDKIISVFGDVSISQRIPTPVEGLGLKNENHLLVISGLEILNDVFDIKTSLWYRSIGNPIIYSTLSDSTFFVFNTISTQGNTIHSTGLNIDVTTPVQKNIILRFTSNFSIDNSKDNKFSGIKSYTDIDCYYLIMAGKSELRLGLNVSGIYQTQWYNFIPQTRTYIQSDAPSKFFYNGLNVYAHAKLGIAYFKINVINLLGSGYYYVANYPAIGRVINFSVNWPFLD